MKKIVLIEDDPDVFNLLKYNVEKEGFKLVGQARGSGALELCLLERPDLIILDIMLPDCDGFGICRMVRRDPQLAGIPIIFVTARGSETDRLTGLELGASDYIVKPFYVREVIARIKVHLREAGETNPILRAGELELDRNTRRVRVGTGEVILTATEFSLLEFLMSRPTIVFKRSQLLDAVWGYDRVVTERTVDVFIRRLRQKVRNNRLNTPLIRSVRGFGYTFDPAPVEPSEDLPSNGIGVHGRP